MADSAEHSLWCLKNSRPAIPFCPRRFTGELEIEGIEPTRADEAFTDESGAGKR